MKKIALALALSLGVFAFGATPGSAAGAAQHFTLTGKDNMQSIQVPVGSTIEFNLNDMTGLNCGAGAVYQGDSITGSGTTFTAAKPGASVVYFACVPPPPKAGSAHTNIIIGYRVGIDVQ